MQALDGDGKPSVSNVIEGRYYMEKEKGSGLGGTTTTRCVPVTRFTFLSLSLARALSLPLARSLSLARCYSVDSQGFVPHFAHCARVLGPPVQAYLAHKNPPHTP